MRVFMQILVFRHSFISSFQITFLSSTTDSRESYDCCRFDGIVKGLRNDRVGGKMSCYDAAIRRFCLSDKTLRRYVASHQIGQMDLILVVTLCRIASCHKFTIDCVKNSGIFHLKKLRFNDCVQNNL